MVIHIGLIVTISIAATALNVQPPAQPASPPAIERYSLANGIRVISFHVPNAEKQCTFSFLPISLATDPAGRAQWSHLLEHMIIRSTDPEGLEAGGVQFNGESQHTSLRLDTYATPDSFRESFEKHARWLAADSFDGAVLAREKQVIAQEEQSVAQNYYTHKFALAAWNQAVRHGASHASVHDDVADAKLADVAAFAARALAVDDSVLVATIGPAAPAEVRSAIEETLGRVAPRQADTSDAQATLAPRAAGAIDATWDLPVRHLMLWWNLDDNSLATRLAAQHMEGSIMQAAMTGGGGAPALAMSLFHLPEGPVVVLNAALLPEHSADAERERLTALVNSIAATPQRAAGTAAMMASQITMIPNFDQMRASVPAANRAYLEGQWILSIANLEYTWGLTVEEIAAQVKNQDGAAISRFSRPPDGTLLLTPRE